MPLSAIQMMHSMERQRAEEDLIEAIGTLRTCTTAGGERWFTDDEILAMAKQAIEDNEEERNE